jgi:hypothetical protein
MSAAPRAEQSPWRSIIEIPVRAGAQPRVEELRRGRPVLFRGSAARWPAIVRWTNAYLRERCGERAVTTYAVRNGDLVFDDRAGLRSELVPFAEAIDHIEDGAPIVRRVRARMAEELPELERDVEVPAACRRLLRLELNFWLSGRGIRSRLHFDQPENLLVQVRGAKDVWLFPPGARRALDPFPLGSPNAQFSRIDLAAPGLDRRPQLRALSPWRCTLAAGDMLFIPGGWWHYLSSDEVTISVGIRWWRRRRWPLLALADLYKRARGYVR